MTTIEGPRPTTTGRLRSGVCIPLEEEANRLIKESLVGVTSHSEKSDILTEWKDRDRHEREVMSSAGFVDPAIRRGMFGRPANPVQTWLNSRDGFAPPVRTGEDPVSSYDGYEGLSNIT